MKSMTYVKKNFDVPIANVCKLSIMQGIMNTIAIQKQRVVILNYEKGNISRSDAVRSLVNLGMLENLAEASLHTNDKLQPVMGLASVLSFQ